VSYYTPPQLAERWGVSPEKVIKWIRSGELRAINLATKADKRPRYRISAEDVALFEARRSCGPAPVKPHRRRLISGVTPYF